MYLRFEALLRPQSIFHVGLGGGSLLYIQKVEWTINVCYTQAVNVNYITQIKCKHYSGIYLDMSDHLMTSEPSEL